MSGDIVEVIEYEKPIVFGYEVKYKVGTRAPPEVTEESKVENKIKSMQRAKQRLRRLINANAWQYHDSKGRSYMPVFLTLTYAENMQDLDQANKDFEKFIKRLNYNLTGLKRSEIKYIAVPEYQSRGAVHFHLVIFNLPYTPAKQISKIWKHGFVKPKGIRHCDNIGAYMSKYLGKAPEGRKQYYASKGLIQPKILKVTGEEEEKKLAELEDQLASHRVYEAKYNSEHLGVIRYKQYNLRREVLSIAKVAHQ